MNETSPRPTESASPTPLHLVEGGRSASVFDQPTATAWTILFGAFAFAGGHGLFLFFALTQLERIPNMAELGGVPNALVVAWLVGSFPMAVLSFLFRRTLVCWPIERLRPLAFGVLAISLAVFALYVRKMVIS